MELMRENEQCHSQSSTNSPRRLILDLVGPFVVHFVDQAVQVYAPQCNEHHANVLTDTDDVPLCGLASEGKEGFVYSLIGPTANKGCTGCSDKDSLLQLNFDMCPRDSSTCHLVFKAPNPDHMFALVPDPIWIHRNGSDPWFDKGDSIIKAKVARGLRLVYLRCESPSIEASPPLPQLSKISFDALGFGSEMYRVTLRFASYRTSSDEHHEDAYNCFQAMRELIPGACKWRVDFDDRELNGQDVSRFEGRQERHGGQHPVDCGAAVLVVHPRLHASASGNDSQG